MLPYSIFEKLPAYNEAYKSLNNFKSFLTHSDNITFSIENDKSIIENAISIYRNKTDKEILKLVLAYSLKNTSNKPEASAIKLAQAFKKFSASDDIFDTKINEIEKALKDIKTIDVSELVPFIDLVLKNINYSEEIDQHSNIEF